MAHFKFKSIRKIFLCKIPQRLTNEYKLYTLYTILQLPFFYAYRKQSNIFLYIVINKIQQ